MHLLVLGGTRFVGRHIVEAARTAGHRVSVFHRGKSGRGLWPDVEEILGDREWGVGDLRERRWDAVIDTSGYVPRVVRTSLEALAESAPHHVFVSTISVYRAFDRPGTDENRPLVVLEDPSVEQVSGESYGGLKALCEGEVRRVHGNDALIVRPGIIVGPHDYTGRFTYWVDRIARGGSVPCPGPPDAPVQFIDARDLGAWIVKMVEGRRSGTFNVVGPDRPLTMTAWLGAIRETTGSDAEFAWVDEDDLARARLEDKMPLWVAPREQNFRYMMDVDGSKAVAAGLHHRPVSTTIRDTLDWSRKDRDRAVGSIGPTPEEEAILLDARAEVR